MKATSILHKAQTLNAKPAELLDIALCNLKAGGKLLMPPMEEEPPTGTDSLNDGPCLQCSLHHSIFHLYLA